MLRKILSINILILSFFVTNLHAEELLTTVVNVIESKKTESILILSGSDGKVYAYPKSDDSLKYFKSFIGENVKINFSKINYQNVITKIQRLNKWDITGKELDLNHFQYNEHRNFTPFSYLSESSVKIIFDNLLNDGDKRRSQCFKRAHMWAYDLWSKLEISSQKIFIFYTQRYIQLEDSEWWFHVAPMVISDNKEYVLDGTFMKEPVSVKEWQHFFIKSENINCPVIENYNDYEQGQFKRLCYLMKVPMYYFSPLDIENRDKHGIIKNYWDLEELQDARRAFKNYDVTYEALDTGKPTITH